MNRFTVLAGVVLVMAQGLPGAELVLPQNRNAFYASEPIEWAVSGLGQGGSATLELVPDQPVLATVSIPVAGHGSTVTVVLPGNSLAPANYAVKLDGKEVTKLTLSTGVIESPLFVSQTGPLREGGANFILGNFFNSGLIGANGLPDPLPRGKRSQGLNGFDNAVAKDLPTVVYMYWTGFVTHKPFGSYKSWAAADVTEALRPLNFRTGQTLRRYSANIAAVGTLDEPGLSWGKTPAGGMASGFPNWDEQAWYEARGWNYTNDPGCRSDADWIKYVSIRCAIIKEQNVQACNDLKASWPSMVFATDIYAPHAIMDGTDPMNQEINDIPTSHVFMDWGVGKLGALSGLYLEKCDNPARKIAHAMNGQLMQATVPQPNQSDSYRVMMNAMIMAGLHGNWWLNMTGMGAADLKAINEPASRLGPLFAGAEVTGHDIAVMWSFTEAALRLKDMAVREASNKAGEQIKLMIASLPEDAVKDGKMVANAYTLGQNYKDNILQTHQAIARAGYPAHILHEKRIAQGWLKHYKVLVIIGQTFELPEEVRTAISVFQKSGGIVVVDKGTTVKFDGAVVTDAAVKDLGFRWGAYFAKAGAANNGLSKRQASLYFSNTFMDEPARVAAPLLKATLATTRARAAIRTESVELAAERHQAGEGELILVLNAHEELPSLADDQSYWLYNYAPLHAVFTLHALPRGAAVYCIEGTDWTRTGRVADPQGPIRGDFAAGEMKLYVVAPRAPKGFVLKADLRQGALTVNATLKGVKMPWPFTLTVTAPDGTVRYSRFRGTNKSGIYNETLPLGLNGQAGDYVVRLVSPIGGLTAETHVKVEPSRPGVAAIADAVRVFDDDVIRSFLATKPSLIVAYGNEGQKAFAVKLAANLAAKGLTVSARPDHDVLRKVKYPRVWNPTAQLCGSAGTETAPPGVVKNEIRLGFDVHGVVTSCTPDGKELPWRTPESRVTIINDGFVDFNNTELETCYEPGVKLYVDAKGQVSVLKGETRTVDTTPAFRAQWARPWHRLTQHNGGFQLPPQLPEAYTTDSHLILLGDSTSGMAVAALQASEILMQVVDEKYPGPGKALLQFAWSPFGIEKNVVFLGASDDAGLSAAADALLKRVSE